MYIDERKNRISPVCEVRFFVYRLYITSEIGNNNIKQLMNIWVLLPVYDIIIMMFYNQNVDKCEAKICVKINWVLVVSM